MQAMFPEGYVFSWALSGLAAAEIARQLPEHDPRQAEAFIQARVALQQIDSPAGRAPFSAQLSPRYGVFYTGWRLYLRATYLRALGPARIPPAEMTAFKRDCDSLAAAYAHSPTPMLPSYVGAAWPADNCVAIAALAIHDQLQSPRYHATITHWVQAARQRLDPAFGAFSHAADPVTGAPRGGVRGSSLALMSRVLLDVAPDLARAHYQVLRTHFVAYRWGIPGVREYPATYRGPADIDSGPLPLGFGGPATVVGAAAARAHGDAVLADALLGTVEVAGIPLEWNGRRYLGGVVPVGDAFIAWANATPVAGTPAVVWPRVLPVGWWWVGHGVSLLLAAIIVWPIWPWGGRRRAGWHFTPPPILPKCL
jgi:hypothetical protein